MNPPELSDILAGLSALRTRERRLLALRAGLLVGAALLLIWVGAMALAAADVQRAVAGPALGISLLVCFAGVMVWLGLRWRAAGELQRHAQLAEGLEPGFRGRLLTALHRKDGPEGQESASILALVARKAAKLLGTLDPRRVHPASVLRWPAFAVVASSLVWLVVSLVGPMGPFGALGWLGGEARAVTKSAQVPDGTPAATALVGDLVLRYEYPEYTGLAPAEVSNSNGTAHGPPGTRVLVRARTDRGYDAALLQVYDQDPVQAELEQGRELSASFTIAKAGVYRFLLQRGVSEDRSPDYAIELEPDLAPVVEVAAASDRLEVSWDQVIPIQWRARDDYGIARVEVALDKADGKPLRELLVPTSSLDGDLARTPDQLGLSPGDEVSLQVLAWDNDEVSGSKSGASRSIRVVVLGPRGQAMRFLRLRKELRDALVDVLAGFAMEPQPPADAPRELARWASEAAVRFDPIDELVETYWDGFDDRSLEGRVVEEVRRQGSSLLRFTQAVSDPREVTEVPQADLDTIAELHEELVGTLEVDIIMLDLMVRYKALGELYGQARKMDEAGRVLRMQAESAAESGALYSRLERIDGMAARLQVAAEEYSGGSLEALVTDWVADLGRMSERTRELLAEGRTEDAALMAADLSDQLARLVRILEGMQAEMRESSEEDAEAIKAFIEKLERIEAEQRDLLARTVALRKTDGGEDAMLSGWKRAEALAQEMHGLTGQVVDAMTATESSRIPGEVQEATRASRQAGRVLRSVQARDVENSVQDVSRAILNLSRTADRQRMMDSRREMRGKEPLDKNNLRKLEQARVKGFQLDALLTELYETANSASPALARESFAFTQEQSQLLEDTEGSLPFARELAGQLPMGAPGLVESLEAAVREMMRAEQALSLARAVEAEGAEEAAADRIRQALEALAQAASATQQMQDSMEGGESGDEESEGSSDDDGDGRISDGEIELPNPEEFRTPEEYREALLEGMQGDVPEEYEALKRRYYEELVRQ